MDLVAQGLLEENDPEDHVLEDHAGQDGDWGDEDSGHAQDSFTPNWNKF